VASLVEKMGCNQIVSLDRGVNFPSWAVGVAGPMIWNPALKATSCSGGKRQRALKAMLFFLE